MKRTFLALIAVVFSISAMSQFTYGPKVGLNLANQSGDDVEDNSMLIGFNAGLMGNYAINDMLSVQLEALYDAKGAKYETVNENNETEDVAMSLSYVSIPVMLKATFGSGDTKFFGEVGPQVGLLMGAKWDGESEYDMVTGFDPITMTFTTEKVKVKDSYKSTDFGVTIGAGTLLPVGGMDLMIDARYTMGLGTISEEPEQGDTPDVKNGVISINFGLMFGGE
ncbi:MAG: PorT family protein [Bacteroidales bacterium]|nr:PorT family protein [Bacteroidales bacterium]